MDEGLAQRLQEHDIAPSAQRMAIAQYVLCTDEHPSAEQTWKRVKEYFPRVSRATVYNTLNLFVEKGLLKEITLTEGRSIFDANMEPHHHFIDNHDGRIHDVPWDSVQVEHIECLPEFEIHEYQVVMRGKRREK